MKLRPRFFVSPLVSAALVVACADVYTTDLELPSAPAETSIDSGSTVVATGLLDPEPPPLCPNVVQASMVGDGGVGLPPKPNGSSCLLAGAVCEYGTSPDRNCNAVYTCPSDTEAWRQLPSETCASADECPKNVGSSALEGLPCGFDGGAGDSDELQCNVSDGVCACTTGRGGPDVHARRWVCTKPLAACPLVRPNQGQPCQTGLLCDYGSCRSKRGLAMTCVGGVWSTTTLDCGI